ncbi:MAG: site-2 protease family protein [Gemmatimonadota bacterium]|nr:MAG: site-2 protease family protein [Gemmatimonadota bacterium]
MTGRLNLVRISGFQIAIDYTWFIIFGLATWGLATGYFPRVLPGMSPLIYWVQGSIATVMLFASVLLHELSHSLVARRYGMEIRTITLFIFGGMAEMAEEPKDASSELNMAAAGPVTSLALGFLCWIVAFLMNSIVTPQVGTLIRYVAYLNVVLALFNIIPGFPLDGGRVLRAVLWRRTGNFKKATNIASRAGKMFAYLLLIVGILSVIGGNLSGIWYVLIGTFLHQAAQMSYMRVAYKENLSGVTVGDLMSRDVVVVDGSQNLDTLVEDFFFKHRFHGFPVLDGDRITGCVTLHDVKEIPRSQWATTRIKEIMAPLPAIEKLHPQGEAVEALSIMLRTGQGRLPVFAGDTLVGVITRRDIMDLFQIKTDLGT